MPSTDLLISRCRVIFAVFFFSFGVALSVVVVSEEVLRCRRARWSRKAAARRAFWASDACRCEHDRSPRYRQLEKLPHVKLHVSMNCIMPWSAPVPAPCAGEPTCGLKVPVLLQVVRTNAKRLHCYPD